VRSQAVHPQGLCKPFRVATAVRRAGAIDRAISINGGILLSERTYMVQRLKFSALTFLACAWAMPAHAAEREQLRMVINPVAAAKMPFPRNFRNNVARTEHVQLDSNGATTARLRWMLSRGGAATTLHPSARADMLRISIGLQVGQTYHYVDDYGLDGAGDVAVRPSSKANRMRP
jgi:hypothetical protein